MDFSFLPMVDETVVVDRHEPVNETSNNIQDNEPSLSAQIDYTGTSEHHGLLSWRSIWNLLRTPKLILWTDLMSKPAKDAAVFLTHSWWQREHTIVNVVEKQSVDFAT
jgi:hypothetical protein